MVDGRSDQKTTFGWCYISDMRDGWFLNSSMEAGTRSFEDSFRTLMVW